MQPLSLTRGRIVALVAGGPVFLAAIVYTSFSAVGLFARTTEQHTASYAWPGGVLAVRSGDGSITVQEGAGSRVDVAYTEHYELRRPTVRVSHGTQGLQLEAACAGGLLGNNCAVNFVITVPTGTALNLQTGDGSVRLAGVSGTVSVHTGDGSVHGSDLRAAEIQAHSGDGSIRLQWASPPRHVIGGTGDGSLDVTLPAGSGPYAVSTRTGQGSVHVNVRTDSKASRTLALSSGDGGISLGYG